MIPLIIKLEDVEWSQTPDDVLLKVPIKGIKANRTNIVTSNDYIRVHYHPYIFEVFLWESVNDECGTCTITEPEGIVIFQMTKVQKNIEWSSLAKDLSREDKRLLRDRAVELTQKRHAEKRKALQEKLHEQKQKVVQDQIRLDGEERQRIANVKAAESSKALSELDEWRSTGTNDTLTQQDVEECPPLLEGLDGCRLDGMDHRSHGDNISNKSLSSNSGLFQPQDNDQTLPAFKAIFTEPTKKIDLGKLSSSNQRPIRQAGKITVSFTPREFPTPSRESTAVEEQEWLKKQAEARKNCGFNDADLRPEERDPMWLLDKGASLLTAESYLGAVSAYSHGIKLAPKMPELYVARAEAHLALKNLVKTVEDASQGLELLTPKVAANVNERLKCHMLRATGFQNLNCYREALMDFQEALKLDPNNDKLKDDISSCEAIIYERSQKGEDSESD